MSPDSFTRYAASLSTFFQTTDAHTAYSLFAHTTSLFPNKQHTFVEDCSFPLRKFLLARKIVSHSEGFKVVNWERSTRRLPSELTERLQDGVISFEYSGTVFEVFQATWRYPDWRGSLGTAFHFVFDGADDSAGKSLVKDIYEWANELKKEIWVFSHGNWSKDSDLYETVQAASWFDVVHEPGFVEALKSDTETFFASEKVYAAIGVTWKRGILLLGPPGNGKTQTIECLLKDLLAQDISPLYVKNFKTDRDEEWGIRAIFEKAREEAPCVLVLEDLDAMVRPRVRSYFLNELDGLARNHGILTIATTNHPEKIDDAILRRPSRFDQKYTFALPSLALRQEYVRIWIAKVTTQGGFGFRSGADVLSKEVAEKTEEWSFAFLKELFVSFLLRSATDRAARAKHTSGKGVTNGAAEHNGHQMTDDEILLHQVQLLAEQVSREGAKIGEGTKDEKEDKEENEKEDEDGCC